MGKQITLLLFLLFIFTNVSLHSQSNSELVASIEAIDEPREKFDKIIAIAKDAENLEEFNLLMEKGEKIATELKNDTFFCLLDYERGYYHLGLGNEETGFNYYVEALKKAEAIPDSALISKLHYSLGTFYFWKEEMEKSLEHMKSSAETYPSYTDPIVKSNILMATGVIMQNDSTLFLASLDYQLRALEIKRKYNAYSQIPVSLNNLAETYFLLGDTVNTYRVLEEAIHLSDSLNDQPAMIYAEYLSGEILFKQKKYAEAIPHLEFATSQWESDNSKKDLSRAYEVLSSTYEQLKMHEEHALTLQRYIEIREELFDSERLAATQEMEAKYQTEKNALIIEQEKNKSTLAQKEAEIAKGKQRSQIIIFSIVGLFLIVGGLYFYSAYKKQKKAKETIDLQRTELAVKNKEVGDSINYAKRIQNAILPPGANFKKHLGDSFIFYQPKDIISGDFYWMEHINGTTLVAAADCTGHGVPGALVSILCHNALNRAVNELGILEPGKVLDKAREIINEKFSLSEDHVRDGMDIALCSIKGKQLQFSGANNPVWILRNGEISVIKANKQPIGHFDKATPFTTHNFELEQGDLIYMFSDGYADQFGGENGKKFKSGNLKKLIVSMANETMPKQKEILQDTFKKWKGKHEQVDDVCVIGIRF